MAAERADQPLRQHRLQRARHEERLDAHVEQARRRRHRVVRVQRAENQVARERGVDRDFGRLQIANFADQDHVRVVPQKAAELPCERQADLRQNLRLVDAVQVILDRVFDRQDLQFRTDDLLERRVKRRGLARSGRSGHQHDAVRPVDDLVERFERRPFHAEVGQRELDRAAIEDAHHDAFAEGHRDHADAQVDLAAVRLDLESAVLRQSPLGDVEVGEDLDAADDRVLKLADGRRHVRVLEHAVDAVAHAKVVLERFAVDVAGPLVDRFEQYLVDELDDRGLLGHLDVEIARLDLLLVDDLELGALLFDHLRQHFAADAVEILDELVDFRAGRQHRHNRHVQAGAQLLQRVHVQRIRRRDLQPALAVAAHPLDRQHAVLMHEPAGHGAQQLAVERHFLQVDDGDVELFAENLQHVPLAHDPVANQDLIDPLVRKAAQRGRIVKLFGGDQAAFD